MLQGFSGLSVQASPSAGARPVAASIGRQAFGSGKGFCRDTLFGIGSITKSFTSVLILQLEAKGVLSIHDTLGKWLPQYPAWSSITIQQLLNMTAPTADYLGTTAFQADLVANIARTFTPEQLVAYAYPAAGPNAPWHYSNTNYILAGMVISRATGLSYEAALRTYLFAPLGLATAYYEPAVPPDSILSAMPASYDYGLECLDAGYPQAPCAQQPLDSLLGTDVRKITLSVYAAAGGIIADLPDVTTWVRAIFGDQLLPPAQKAELFSLVSEQTGLPIASTSATDPAGFSLGIAQIWFPNVQGHITWYYEGEPFGDRVAWLKRPDDPLVITLGLNSSAITTRDVVAPLYEGVVAVMEPPVVTDVASQPAPPTSQ